MDASHLSAQLRAALQVAEQAGHHLLQEQTRHGPHSPAVAAARRGVQDAERELWLCWERYLEAHTVRLGPGLDAASDESGQQSGRRGNVGWRVLRPTDDVHGS